MKTGKKSALAAWLILMTILTIHCSSGNDPKTHSGIVEKPVVLVNSDDALRDKIETALATQPAGSF